MGDKYEVWLQSACCAFWSGFGGNVRPVQTTDQWQSCLESFWIYIMILGHIWRNWMQWIIWKNIHDYLYEEIQFIDRIESKNKFLFNISLKAEFLNLKTALSALQTPEDKLVIWVSKGDNQSLSFQHGVPSQHFVQCVSNVLRLFTRLFPSQFDTWADQLLDVISGLVPARLLSGGFSKKAGLTVLSMAVLIQPFVLHLKFRQHCNTVERGFTTFFFFVQQNSKSLPIYSQFPRPTSWQSGNLTNQYKDTLYKLTTCPGHMKFPLFSNLLDFVLHWCLLLIKPDQTLILSGFCM